MREVVGRKFWKGMAYGLPISAILWVIILRLLFA